MRLAAFLIMMAGQALAIDYATWIATHSSLTLAERMEEADPDKDGLPNLVEFALANGDADTPGPWTIQPVGGFASRLADGSMAEAQPGRDAAPYGSHLALTFKPRADIENIAIMPEVSMKQNNSLSMTESSLNAWYGGSSIIRLDSLPNGAVQASTLLRSDQWPRGFMRLQILTGDGLTTQAVTGTVQPSLRFEPVQRIYRTVGTQTTQSITDRDLTYTQVTSPLQVSDLHWNFSAGNTGYSAGQMVRSSLNTGVVTPHGSDAGLWTYQSDGTATLRVTTPARIYETTVTTNSNATVISRTPTGNVAGSLRAHLVTQTDGRMGPYTGINERALVFEVRNFSTATYTRNPACWLTGVDMTPVCAASASGWRYTLISPRHAITASHVIGNPGDTLHFVASDNTLVVRTVTAVSPIAGSDLQVVLLNADVPGSIAFARVLPQTWATKLPTLAFGSLPVINWNQGHQVAARDLLSLSTSVGTVPPTNPTRLSFYIPTIGGDSSSPCCLIVNNALVLLTTWYSGGPGGASGPFVTAYYTQVNAAMTALGGGYQLTDVVLSGFTSF